MVHKAANEPDRARDRPDLSAGTGGVPKWRTLLRAGLPIGDQGLVAAFNLGLQLTLIRFATQEDYGLFVLWQAIVMIVVTFQEASVGVPLSVRISFNADNPRRFVLERQLAGFSALVVATAAVVGFVAVFVTAPASASQMLPFAVALYAAAFVTYAATRFLALSRMAFAVALLIDGVYTCLSLMALFALYVASGSIALAPLFAMLSLPLLVAAGCGLLVLPRTPAVRIRGVVRSYRSIWRDSRWTALAALSTEVQNRAYVFILTAIYGPAVMAGVFAGLLLMRHINVLTMAWTSFARPQMAKLRDEGAYRALTVFVGASVVAFTGLYVVNLGVLALVWPLVESYVYADKFEGMWPVVVLWTIISIAQMPIYPLSVALVVLGRYRDDCAAVVAGACVTLTAVILLGLLVGPLAAVSGSIAGFVISVAIMAVKLRQELLARFAAATSA
ncbi:MAG: hypothetical protein AAF580_10470 [Pseudomonadota bacterium]